MTHTIAPLTLQDMNVVASVHISAFPKQALSRLGEETVRRYYSSLHRGPFELTALGAFAGSSLQGFLYGGMLRGELSYFLDHNRSFLLKRIALRPWLITDPIFRNRLGQGIKLIKKPEQLGRRPEEVRDPSLRSFGVLSIAVHSQWQRAGVGQRLLQAAEDIAIAQGYARMHLTVHPDNVTAIAFYESQGWAKHYVDGKWTTAMRKSII